MPPLLAAARPIYGLYGKRQNLWAHVNFSPGNHNFGRDNREALYRMFGVHFFPNRTDYDAREIDVSDQVRPSNNSSGHPRRQRHVRLACPSNRLGSSPTCGHTRG
ncbi:MAG: hypothetical protein Ct9H300mP1_27390 [Planctomycetaceae bacterium]|nr:MAG: hypothetical protein Ct9H300mP1_27390 [Planctomycetaceae bacterium]